MEEPGRLQSMGSLRVRHDEWLHFHFSLSCIGEGNGNPLQCSCLENPRDGGAWRAAVYGVAQSWARLKQLSSRVRVNPVSENRHDWLKMACGYTFTQLYCTSNNISKALNYISITLLSPKSPNTVLLQRIILLSKQNRYGTYFSLNKPSCGRS